MPVDTTTITVGEAIDDLDDRLDQIAAEAEQADDPAERDALDQQGLEADQRLAALEDLAQEYSQEATFVIGEMTADERMRFGDLLEAAREQAEQRRGFEAGSNMRDVFWTGAGVVEAPWLDGEETMHERVVALRSDEVGVDWHVIQFLKAKVTEVNSKGNPERKSYAQRRAEKTPQNGRD